MFYFCYFEHDCFWIWNFGHDLFLFLCYTFGPVTVSYKSHSIGIQYESSDQFLRDLEAVIKMDSSCFIHFSFSSIRLFIFCYIFFFLLFPFLLLLFCCCFTYYLIFLLIILYSLFYCCCCYFILLQIYYSLVVGVGIVVLFLFIITILLLSLLLLNLLAQFVFNLSFYQHDIRDLELVSVVWVPFLPVRNFPYIGFIVY